MQNEVALFEIKIGLLQRERQTEFNSQISGKLDIRFLRNLLFKDSLYCTRAPAAA